MCLQKSLAECLKQKTAKNWYCLKYTVTLISIYTIPLFYQSSQSKINYQFWETNKLWVKQVRIDELHKRFFNVVVMAQCPWQCAWTVRSVWARKCWRTSLLTCHRPKRTCIWLYSISTNTFYIRSDNCCRGNPSGDCAGLRYVRRRSRLCDTKISEN